MRARRGGGAVVRAQLRPRTARRPAVLVLVDGRPVLERYCGGLPEDSYDTFSVGKSIVSSPVGIAIAEGKLRGVDVTLAEALPQYRTVIRPEVARTTLRRKVADDDGGSPRRPAVRGTTGRDAAR